MHDSRTAVSRAHPTRLRRVSARMVSGPNVLSRGRFAPLYRRWDRERFGWDGPAARPRWTHFAAALIGAVVMLAIAGAH